MRSVPDEESQEGEDEESRRMQNLVLGEVLMVRDLVCWEKPECGQE
jgi:hypothetical protein